MDYIKPQKTAAISVTRVPFSSFRVTAFSRPCVFCIPNTVAVKEEIIRIRSISQLCELSGFGKPSHPLIYVVDVSQWVIGKEMVGKKFVSDLYSVALKDKSCGMMYGRHSYDFDEGVLIFTAPDQVVLTTK